MSRDRKPRSLPTLLLLTAALLFLLSGCSEAADTSGLAGSYVLTYASGPYTVMTESQVREQCLILILREDGSGEISGRDLDGRIRWGLDGGSLVVDAGSIRLKGYAENGSLLLEESGSGATLRFEAETQTPDPVAPDVTETADAWLGDWYGWWKIESELGSMPRSWYDCCARIAEQEDGSLLLTLWDEDGTASEPIAELRMIRRGETIEALGGYFLFAEVREGEWRLERPDPALYLADELHDAEGERFSYSIYLRPWGKPWIGAEKDQLPFYYEDWYLPAIRAGEKMPDRIPWQKMETKRENPGD